jgi:hypothetical protein
VRASAVLIAFGLGILAGWGIRLGPGWEAMWHPASVAWLRPSMAVAAASLFLACTTGMQSGGAGSQKGAATLALSGLAAVFLLFLVIRG